MEEAWHVFQIFVDEIEHVRSVGRLHAAMATGAGMTGEIESLFSDAGFEKRYRRVEQADYYDEAYYESQLALAKAYGHQRTEEAEA